MCCFARGAAVLGAAMSDPDSCLGFQGAEVAGLLPCATSEAPGLLFSFITLGPELSDTKVYEP